MARDARAAALDAGGSEAIVATGVPMAESRVRLFGDLATCGTPAAASEAIARRMGHRLEEFGADQARLSEAWPTLVARTAAR